MADRAKQIVWELSLSWVNDMTDEQSAEAKRLLGELVDTWMERLKEDPEDFTDARIEDLNKKRRGAAGPAERLEILRFEAFNNKRNLLSYRAYSTARQIVDGVLQRDDRVVEEGKRLMDAVVELRNTAPSIPADWQASVEMDLSEAFLEANFVWRGGGMSMRLGNYARTKAGR